MKKIVFLIDGLGLGGAERTTVQLACGLKKKYGYDTAVMALPRTSFLTTQNPALRGCFDELIEAGIPVTVFPKHSRFPIHFISRLSQVIAEMRPDIVHTQLFTADTFGTLAAHRAHVPVIVSTEQNINIDEGRLKQWCKCYTHRFHADVACISEAVRSYVQRTCAHAQKLALPIIHNAVDVERFSSIPVQRAARATPVMSIVGRLVPQKGHVDMLRALSRVTLPFTLRIVGSGPLESQIRDSIQQYGLSDRVTLEPARRDVESVYADSDILLFPSRWEGLGIVALEASASGCPIIASNVDGLREVVRNNETGLCVDMQNEDDVVRAVSRLLGDTSLRERYGAAGRRFVTDHFSVERMLAEYDRWYTSLC